MMVSINMEETGKNIRRLMNGKGISVKELTSTFGFANTAGIYKWLRGESLPALDNLVILADLFGCTVDRILITERR